MIKESIAKVVAGENLSRIEMKDVFNEIMTGSASEGQIAAFITALRIKGETVEEITGGAEIMRKYATHIKTRHKKVLDTCGTGGDGAHTFNISTISALVAAGAGVIVAKHGNKSVSSKCGSADLLSEFGINVDPDARIIEKCLDEIGIGFLFAPALHSAMKYAAPVRRQIGIRTIFNILGPITNPAGASNQLLGVYDKNLVEPLANVLKNLGSSHALVVHGLDGLDEVTTADKTFAAELKGGDVKIYNIEPRKFGLPTSKKTDLAGGNVKFNLKLALDLLGGKTGPYADIVILNAGCAIYVADMAKDIKEGVELARSSIASGKALEKLNKLKELSNTKI
ncbi:MAG: anthranilate phosphoribosyltransferase [Candidatus Omnitrophica bacterium CG07_land_8_20_14_0_80_42_15]|uniref:Anthranilate phosphoribosyltransferase n=1 Tax=Candidatus Aquitaenariimonas noxiae TaxID=1974741 RepID=A0A2J0KUZ3_9BACT|nr:MAG: anthranilate phosphoribosyltransferase [Candidatus Omnitrophica bacterium CG07_land_8_20_14_0_80_42_15]